MLMRTPFSGHTDKGYDGKKDEPDEKALYT
jgi:hypothetical protein